MPILELASPIEVDTPLGRGWAHIVESDAIEQWWTVILNDSRAVVVFKNDKLRAVRSYSHGRALGDEEMRAIIAL